MIRLVRHVYQPLQQKQSNEQWLLSKRNIKKENMWFKTLLDIFLDDIMAIDKSTNRIPFLIWNHKYHSAMYPAVNKQIK